MPSHALTTPALDDPVTQTPAGLPDLSAIPSTRSKAPSLAESLITSASSCTTSQQDAYTRNDITTYILEDFRTSSIYISFEMFLAGVMNLPDEWPSNANFKACVDKLEADATLREKLDAYFAQCEVNKHKDQTLSAIFDRANGVLANLDGIAQDSRVYVYPRTDLKAPMTLLNSGASAYIVLDKDGKDPRNEKDMNDFRREAIRNETLAVASQLSDGARKRPSNSQAESPKYKKRKLQAPANAANSAHQLAQPHSSQVTCGDDSAEHLIASYQCADYALQFMSYGGLRNHCFGTLICDDDLQLMYYDHSCIAVAKPLNMRADRHMFMLYLVCLYKLSLSDRSGLPPTAILQNPRPYLENYNDYAKVNDNWYNILSGQVLLLQDQTSAFEVTLGRIIARPIGIIGRCTFIVNATSAKWPGMELIVKIIWSPTSRTSEADFMRNVRQAVSQTGADWVLDHVPNILHSQDFPHLPNQIGGRLSAFLKSLHEDDWTSGPGEFEYEDRIMRVSVHEKLYKLSELDKASNHAQVFHDVVQVHRWLYDFPHIIHRDISHSNMMWHFRRGRICGVLNDFDLSSYRDNTAPSSKQRTGTHPYMARELHQQERIRHLYRHDLESLFYVLLLLTGAYILLDEPEIDSITKEKCYLVGDKNSPYKEWSCLHEVILRSQKDAVVGSEHNPYTHPSFAELSDQVSDARMCLLEGSAAQYNHKLRRVLAQGRRRGGPLNPAPVVPDNYDDETMGGHWTYNNFLDCIGAGFSFERMYPEPCSMY